MQKHRKFIAYVKLEVGVRVVALGCRIVIVFIVRIYVSLNLWFTDPILSLQISYDYE